MYTTATITKKYLALKDPTWSRQLSPWSLLWLFTTLLFHLQLPVRCSQNTRSTLLPQGYCPCLFALSYHVLPLRDLYGFLISFRFLLKCPCLKLQCPFYCSILCPILITLSFPIQEHDILLYFFQESSKHSGYKDFPGSPVVRTAHSHFFFFAPSSGLLDPSSPIRGWTWALGSESTHS